MKVKVNRVRGGSMGDQRNYGLITGSIWNYEDKPSSNQVGTTMSPVPRDEATIEAERGETIVGDLDNDGMLEHAIVGGKRHFAGGTPLNVPDGSFVFSDTRALKINNKDVLKGIFNMGGTGITPAKVAKRYDLNQYKDLLMDPESDLLTKKTAQMMIDNNMKKLGQLALIQEGMKGFPDGIPNIALPLFANDIAQPESSEGTPMMKRGGLVKAQAGKQVNSAQYPQEFYEYWSQYAPNIRVQNPKYKGSVIKEYQPEPYESKVLRFLKDEALPVASFATMINPYSAMLNASMEPSSVKGYQFQGGGTKPKVKPAEDEGVPEWLKKYLVIGTGALTPEIVSGIGSAAGWVGKNIPWDKIKPSGWPMDLWNRLPNGAKLKEVLKSAPKQLKKPIPRVGLALGLTGLSDYLNWFGNEEAEPETLPLQIPKGDIRKISSSQTSLPIASDNVVSFDPTSNQVQTVAPTQPKVSKPTSVTQTYNPREIEIDSTVLENISKEYGGNIKYQNGREKFTAYRPESKITSSQDWGVIPPSQTFPYKFGVQSFDPNLGVYTITDPKTGKNIPLDLTDYYNRLETTEKETGIPIISSYDKGADQLKKDIISPDLATRKKAVGHVQRAYNEARTKLGLPPYFYGKPGKDPYGIDEMFGLYTFSSPGLKKMQTLQPAAGVQDQEPVTTTQTTELGKIPSPTYTGGYAAPWSNYSMVDNAAALANYFNISRGDLPIKQQFTPYMPDATFMDPARAIAQQQGLTRASQEAIMSGADPTTGRANVIAAQAAAAPQTADIMSKYDQANVGIANQMESARAQIMNEAELRNLGLDKQYMDEIATLNQQYENALAAGRTEVAESVKRAMVDAMQRGALNVQNPNYAIGPNGQIYFKPGFNPATGTNIFAGASGSGNIPALMKSYMTEYGLTGDQAAALIRAQLASRGRNSYGVNNPMDALWNSEV